MVFPTTSLTEQVMPDIYKRSPKMTDWKRIPGLIVLSVIAPITGTAKTGVRHGGPPVHA